MRRVVVISVVLATLAACASNKPAVSAAQLASLQKQRDTAAIDQIEVVWHKASSLKDVNLMMTIWADDATFTVGSQTYTGKAQIRNFFATKAAPFKPQNHWESDTPAYKVRITVNGDQGTLYFECHYIDVATRKVAAVVAADQNVERINGRWLIKSSSSATPDLTPY
jgi:ketosteroid isomerase-like protein